MAHKRYIGEWKILPYDRKEKYLPGCWWLDYHVSGNSDYNLIRINILIR